MFNTTIRRSRLPKHIQDSFEDISLGREDLIINKPIISEEGSLVSGNNKSFLVNMKSCTDRKRDIHKKKALDNRFPLTEITQEGLHLFFFIVIILLISFYPG